LAPIILLPHSDPPPHVPSAEDIANLLLTIEMVYGKKKQKKKQQQN